MKLREKLIYEYQIMLLRYPRVVTTVETLGAIGLVAIIIWILL